MFTMTLGSQGAVIKVVMALLALMATMLAVPATADCGQIIRSINFDGRPASDYTESDWSPDFSPYVYFDSTDQASIAKIGSTSYLKLIMKKGCIGTQGKCGMQGRMTFDGLEAATLKMTVRFGKGWEWVRGGKLPGLCGGDCTTGCSESNHGFSVRTMWTDNICTGADAAYVPCTYGVSGGMHAYVYSPGKAKDVSCGEEITYRTRRNGSLYDHVIRDGEDLALTTYIKMNTPGKQDGVISMWLNGQFMGSKTTMEFRKSYDVQIDQLLFHDFFGGGSASMSARKDESLYIKDLRIWSGECLTGSTPGPNIAFDKGRQPQSAAKKTGWKSYSKPAPKKVWKNYSKPAPKKVWKSYSKPAPRNAWKNKPAPRARQPKGNSAPKKSAWKAKPVPRRPYSRKSKAAPKQSWKPKKKATKSYKKGSTKKKYTPKKAAKVAKRSPKVRARTGKVRN